MTFICPFCKLDTSFSYVLGGIIPCFNHDALLLMNVSKSQTLLNTWIYKDEFEIRSNYQLKSTTLRKYMPATNSQLAKIFPHQTKLLRGKFYYSTENIISTPLHLKKLIKVSPDNFDFYLNKLKTILTFS